MPVVVVQMIIHAYPWLLSYQQWAALYFQKYPHGRRLRMENLSVMSAGPEWLTNVTHVSYIFSIHQRHFWMIHQLLGGRENGVELSNVEYLISSFIPISTYGLPSGTSLTSSNLYVTSMHEQLDGSFRIHSLYYSSGLVSAATEPPGTVSFDPSHILEVGEQKWVVQSDGWVNVVCGCHSLD